MKLTSSLRERQEENRNKVVRERVESESPDEEGLLSGVLTLGDGGILWLPSPGGAQ